MKQSGSTFIFLSLRSWYNTLYFIWWPVSILQTSAKNKKIENKLIKENQIMTFSLKKANVLLLLWYKYTTYIYTDLLGPCKTVYTQACFLYSE